MARRVRRLYELLRQPFAVVPGLVIPAGGYQFDDLRSEYQFGPQRRLSGTVAAAFGGFYDGTRPKPAIAAWWCCRRG